MPLLLTTCSRCGAQVPVDSAFCSHCGSSVNGDVAFTHQDSAPAFGGAGEVLPRLTSAVAVHYRVERELGRGGMATVYLAHDLKRDRKVAIKVLHPDLAATVGADRFQREIDVAGKLQHPGILGLYDSGGAEGLLYYVMPFVEGESLRDRLDRDGQLPVDEAIAIFRQVAEAIGFAHARGVVHRDIKPENILLQGGRALVADFGIARTVIEGQQKLTQTGMAVGTPVYMAPEQAVGEKVGPSADVYALGCVLYEMLAGEPPFTGKNAMAIMARHAREQVPSIRIVRPSVPEEVEALIWAAMEKIPADRPQSCEKLLEILGMDGATAMRMTPTMQRRAPGAAPTAAAPPPTPAWRRPLVLAAAALVVVAAAAAGWQLTRRAATPLDDATARRLAVLYFRDASPDSSLAPLADGLTEALIGSLNTIPSLTVISSGGVAPFRGSTLPIDSVARALRAGYLVRGEVAPAGDQVRVNLTLDDATGFTVERASFSRPAGSLLAMRDTLAIVASELIRKQVGEDLASAAQRASTASDAAWLLVQRGEQARRAGEEAVLAGDSAAREQRFGLADSLFTLAERQDPKWVEPIVRRAQLAYRRARLVELDPPALRRWVGTGLGHAARAVALDPSSADAHQARGDLEYLAWLRTLDADPVRRDAGLAQAKADLERAVALNPRQAGAYAMLSHLYYNDGTPTDVNIAAQRALEADEFLSNADVVLNRLFLSSYDLRQADRADQHCRETQRRFPRGINAVRCQLFVMTVLAGETPAATIDTAWALADSVVARTPPARQPYQRLNASMLVAAVIAKAARAPGAPAALADSARGVVRRSEGDPTMDPTRELAFFGGFVHGLLGDTDDALRLLKTYLAANPQRVPAFRDDPGWWYRDLGTDPRFRQLVGATR